MLKISSHLDCTPHPHSSTNRILCSSARYFRYAALVFHHPLLPHTQVPPHACPLTPRPAWHAARLAIVVVGARISPSHRAVGGACKRCLRGRGSSGPCSGTARAPSIIATSLGLRLVLARALPASWAEEDAREITAGRIV